VVLLKNLSKILILLGIIHKFFNVIGEYNSVGRVLGCGSKSHGFKPRYSPQNKLVVLKSYSNALNGCLNIKIKNGRF
jgi:hypothetical protein